MAMFTIKNPAPGVRMVQVAKGKKQVAILPGAERTLPLSDEAARRYAQAGANNPKYLQIRAADAEARAVLSGGDASSAEDTGGSPEDTGGDGFRGTAPNPQAELLARADAMPVEDLRAEARLVLGTKWPRRGSGELTRDQIKELLAVKE